MGFHECCNRMYADFFQNIAASNDGVFFAGAGDATYHLMWIFLFNALDDIGVWETNETTRTGNPPYSAPEFAEVEQIKKQVMEQAINGALRIAALAGVLTENFYMVRIFHA